MGVEAGSKVANPPLFLFNYPYSLISKLE